MKEPNKEKTTEMKVKELHKWAAATKILIHSTESALAFKVLGLSPNVR